VTQQGRIKGRADGKAGSTSMEVGGSEGRQLREAGLVARASLSPSTFLNGIAGRCATITISAAAHLYKLRLSASDCHITTITDLQITKPVRDNKKSRSKVVR
jgi:hypothetical protein